MANIQGRAGGGTVQMSIRIPPALRDRIKDQADSLGRSINTHVVMTMREATKMATGAEPASISPAAGDDEAALQGGSL